MTVDLMQSSKNLKMFVHAGYSEAVADKRVPVVVSVTNNPKGFDRREAADRPEEVAEALEAVDKQEEVADRMIVGTVVAEEKVEVADKREEAGTVAAANKQMEPDMLEARYYLFQAGAELFFV